MTYGDDLTLSQLRVFAAVSASSSFTSAARRMNVSPSTLSRSVAALEHTLGVVLFRRDTRNVELTHEGRRFLKVADRLLYTLQSEMLQFERYSSAHSGVLALAALASYASALVPRMLPPFLEGSDGMELRLLDGAHHDVLDHLRSGEVELALTADPVDEEFEFHELFIETFYAVVPREHPWASEESVNWRDFEGETFVAARVGTSIRRLCDDAFDQADMHVQHRFEVANIATLGGLVRAGFGVSALPAMEFEGYRLDDLTRLLIVGTTLVRVSGLAHLRGATLSPAARRFLEVAPDLLQLCPVPMGVTRATVAA
jgi:DNA-binding transcriptional LysR family regulator